MHDRDLNPIPDLIVVPGGTLCGNTEDGCTWLGIYSATRPPASLRQRIADAQDDGLLVEDRR